MKRWWVVIALLLSVGINVGLVVSRILPSQAPARDETTAGPQRPERPSPELGRLRPVIIRLANQMGLRGERREAFFTIQRRFFEETLSTRRRVEDLQKELRRALLSEDPDRDAVDRMLDELGTAHADLERAFVRNLLDSRQLLDAEQERVFVQFLGRVRQFRRQDDPRRLRDRRLGPNQRLWDPRQDRRRPPADPQDRRRRPSEDPRPPESPPGDRPEGRDPP